MRFSLIILLFLLSACASGGPRYQQATPPAGTGILYVYRLNTITDRFLPAELVVNSKSRQLESGQFVTWDLPEGEHIIRTNCLAFNSKEHCEGSLTVKIVSGEEHFVRFNPRSGNDMDANLSKVFSAVTKEPANNTREGFLQYMGRPQGRSEIRALVAAP